MYFIYWVIKISGKIFVDFSSILFKNDKVLLDLASPADFWILFLLLHIQYMQMVDQKKQLPALPPETDEKRELK